MNMKENLKTSKSEISFGIRIKLLLGFSVVLLLTLLVGGVGYYGTQKIIVSTEDLGGHWSKANIGLAQVLTDTEDTRRTLLLGFTMRADAQEFQADRVSFTNFKTEWEKDFSTYTKYVTSESGKVRTAEMQKLFTSYMADADQVWNLTAAGKDVEARPILTQNSKATFEQVLKVMNDQMSFQDQAGSQALVDAHNSESFVITLLIIIIILALIVGAILAVMLAQHISRPLVEVTKVTQSVADGDLNVKMPTINNKDEIGVLSQAVSQMVGSLREVIGEVLVQSENVAATSQELSAAAEEATAASGQVSDTIAQLAAGATDQAISVGETVRGIQELSASAQQVATNAEIVSQSSGKAAQAAELGALQAENAVQKIEEIRQVSTQTAEAIFQLGDQSKQIGQIVDVIKSIADQTNLLALNAAIEAARAGEQGRGFAVVAEEVRKLAEQSSTSAAQIATLIGNIQRETERAVGVMEKGKVEVAAGVEAVNLAGHSFRTIVGEVNTVVEQIRLVTVAAQQMASGTAQTVNSVESIGVVAEQTAASSQEVSAVSEEQAATMVSVSQSAEALAKLGETLSLAVRKFKV
ncbi:Methyl-accepting chemotaxis protein [Candidatus Desulfosporosinus infrequens]|uniref:Methyl-accepting chemotaxis protein n=1 Tax=Candidatus Desulfosporosinus infrequens TaxID=2043169 RepID=A0A2U3KLY1_9FIRM|nr:Methyl-accepting chemotaxis protein [Candidatus Desulfosporosinus infrequens]